MRKKIRNALISVYHKDNLEPIVRQLHALGITMFTTGGTQEFIEGLKIPVTAVESLTDYPSILGGRVKTLHPKIFGGILSRRENESDILQMEEYHIPEIDLVVVDLYPFEDAAPPPPEGGSLLSNEAIELIDIGGISLIRAAAKNFRDVLIIPSRNQYAFLLDILIRGGESTLDERKISATHAFNISSHYDSAIFNYFNADEKIKTFKQSIQTSRTLRYGENPHQQGIFYGKFDEMFDQLHGKEISYNNLLDIDAAVSLMSEFGLTPGPSPKERGVGDTTIAILKHNNACGVASRENLVDAWKDALAADPVSAFGGIIITNKKVDKQLAEEMHNLFFEVLITPSIDDDALTTLKQKKNRIILIQKNFSLQEKQFRSMLNGVAVQDRDSKTETGNDMQCVTNNKPTAQQISDMEFANKIVKHTKSNTIVLAKNKMLLASGTGQTSRVDALQQAIAKAKHFNFDLNGAVMSSDAFFPFADCVEIADKAGIKTVIQPGGSIKDKESIDYCNAHGITMVMTGTRHFKH